jgi:site-specific DNA-methyltransferase (adenine-specific)
MNDNSTKIQDTTQPQLLQNGCYVQPFSEVFNEDCIQVMKRYPDKFFDLAVVDPPYGLGKVLQHTFGKENKLNKQKLKDWDNSIPCEKYFDELFRVSKNQIIWGGNYFLEHLNASRGFITWDKMVYIPSMSRIEWAWTSFDVLPKLIQINNNDPNRIHLTQKPVKLYDWIFHNYASERNLILDTHLGSGSSRIAAHKAALSFVGCEIDKDYFDAQEKRYKEFVSQLRLF